jgi:hypothetical protein
MEVASGPEPRATSRSQMADLNLPSALYQYFSQDEAEFLDYSGGRDAWDMHWRYPVTEPLTSASARFATGLPEDADWRLLHARTDDAGWDSRWGFTGRDGAEWLASVRIDESTAGSTSSSGCGVLPDRTAPHL